MLESFSRKIKGGEIHQSRLEESRSRIKRFQQKLSQNVLV